MHPMTSQSNPDFLSRQIPRAALRSILDHLPPSEPYNVLTQTRISQSGTLMSVPWSYVLKFVIIGDAGQYRLRYHRTFADLSHLAVGKVRSRQTLKNLD